MEYKYQSKICTTPERRPVVSEKITWAPERKGMKGDEEIESFQLQPARLHFDPLQLLTVGMHTMNINPSEK
jgi:hypothetical protein